MIHNAQFKQLEFIILFIVFLLLFLLQVLPLSFLMPIIWMLALYAFFILKITAKSIENDFKKELAISIFIRFIIIGLTFILLCYIWYPHTFLQLLSKEPKIFLALLVLYPFLSVIPQEVLYREFFFKRYAFKLHTNILLLLNALLFMWAHIVFGNSVVLILTLIAGLLFAHTYLKSCSFLLVCIEHTLYGYLLFISGLGELFLQSGTLTFLRTLFS